MGTWHKIEAGRSGRDGYLTLDGTNNMGNAPPGNWKTRFETRFKLKFQLKIEFLCIKWKKCPTYKL